MLGGGGGNNNGSVLGNGNEEWYQYGKGGNAMLKVEKQLQVSFEMPFRWMWPSKPFKFCDYYLSPSPIKEKFLGTPNHLESKYRP